MAEIDGLYHYYATWKQSQNNYWPGCDCGFITVLINPIKYKSRANLKCDLQALYKLLRNALLVHWRSVQQQAKKKKKTLQSDAIVSGRSQVCGQGCSVTKVSTGRGSRVYLII